MGNTIAAIATPLATGGIGVIRLSGENVFIIADRVLRLRNHQSICELKGYTCAYGYAVDEKDAIDEVIVTVFRAPHSYTGEDVVEISAHGGVYLLSRILRLCLEHGAEAAEAGEFTKRAFLNGKLDLTQAEAVTDLIAARGRQAAKAAFCARSGALYQKVQQVADILLGEAAHLAAWIDYPEDEIVEIDNTALIDALMKAKAELCALLKTYDSGKVIREGIETAIVGRPNAGKSTLMNLMAGCTRSIVTDIAGTTRDIVSDTVQIGDLVLHLSDTAGIRFSDNPIEQTGVELAERKLEQAQLVLAMFDGSEPLSEDDLRVIHACKGTTAIALINKNDLPQKLEKEKITESFSSVIEITAKNADGMEKLQEEIGRLFEIGTFDPSAAVLANERQHKSIMDTLREVEEAINALKNGVSYDAVCVCIENGIDHLLMLVGKRASDEVVNQVFSKFCVGK